MFKIITSQQAQDIFWEDSEEFETVNEPAWKDDGKYSFAKVIFTSRQSRDKYYQLSVRRSGSYHTDYYYEWDDVDEFKCDEVVPKERLVITWVKVK